MQGYAIRRLAGRWPCLSGAMEDANSTCTSVDDRTEEFGDNPTRDTLTEGLVALLRPTVDSLQNSIKNTKYVSFSFQLFARVLILTPSEFGFPSPVSLIVEVTELCIIYFGIILIVTVSLRASQQELSREIEFLLVELATIYRNQQCPIDLDGYVKKLLDARARVTIINSILHNVQVI